MAWRKSAAIAGMLVLGLGAASPLTVLAQRPNTVPKETCAGPVPPPPALAAWTQPTDLAAARHPAELAQAALTPGRAVTAQFYPVADVEYRVAPEKADGPQVYGGMFALKITRAGTYRVAAGAGPWMDLFQGKTPVTSVAHGHGPACTGVGKMVDFPLQPGDYLVQFSESLTPRTEILVAMLPPQ
jgi:hypothetical protein